MKIRPWLLLLSFALVAALGYWLAGTAVPEAPRKSETKTAVAKPSRPPVPDEPLPKFRRNERPPGWQGDAYARIAGALEGQRVISFADRDALNRFLARNNGRLRILGRLDALNSLRVAFDNPGDLASLLDGDEEQSFIFPVTAPYPPEGSVQPGAVGMGNSLHEWLGIDGDNSAWGKGVRIAVLDTGVSSHAAFNTTIRGIDLIDSTSGSDPNGHGTAVTSMIIGGNPQTPGVAPSAEIIAVRIADNGGVSDSFVLAKGIIAAVDAGAQIINISMGSFGDSALVRRAIDYAQDSGSLIIAAAGNNGLDQVTYPAANSGVVAVGAVDAAGRHLAFSNSGESVDLSAPGLALNAAWPGDKAASVTGTSFSAPIIAGAIAAVMTETGVRLTPEQAYQRLTSFLNDGDQAGPDSKLGRGMPDLGRTLAGNTPGIHDAAVAAQRILQPDPGNPYGQIEVLIQNRGTETLINTAVEVGAGGGTITSNITSLAPNAVRTIRVPLPRPLESTTGGIEVEARVRLSDGSRDAKPSNDRRVETHSSHAPL